MWSLKGKIHPWHVSSSQVMLHMGVGCGAKFRLFKLMRAQRWEGRGVTRWRVIKCKKNPVKSLLSVLLNTKIVFKPIKLKFQQIKRGNSPSVQLSHPSQLYPIFWVCDISLNPNWMLRADVGWRLPYAHRVLELSAVVNIADTNAL